MTPHVVNLLYPRHVLIFRAVCRILDFIEGLQGLPFISD